MCGSTSSPTQSTAAAAVARTPSEADRAVAILTEHLTDFPEREVAITAMSSAQQVAINERIEAQATDDSRLQDWVDAGGRVKNLETVQGDECDTMILSLGYGRDAGGRLMMNFGPLGQTNGDRRLNVAITRARWQTILVSSIHAADIRDDDSLTEGARRLRDYLDYAERGPSALPGVAASALAGPFEERRSPEPSPGRASGSPRASVWAATLSKSPSSTPTTRRATGSRPKSTAISTPQPGTPATGSYYAHRCFVAWVGSHTARGRQRGGAMPLAKLRGSLRGSPNRWTRTRPRRPRTPPPPLSPRRRHA